MQDTTASLFALHRKTLEEIAYRMLGTLAEAQDVVQETYLRWHRQPPATVENPRAWLIVVCSRLALNHLASAKRARRQYPGEWLPEPIPTPSAPDTRAELAESISFALLRALETLSPVERAVFLLHDVFELAFEEIARVVGKTPSNCRQLAARARRRIQEGRPRFRATAHKHQQLLEGFFRAAQQLDLSGLLALLSQDVELFSDGGGLVEALPQKLCGATQVGRFLVDVFTRYEQKNSALQGQFTHFNGAPGLLMYEGDTLATALTIEAEGEQIARIYAVRNPNKLSGFCRERA